MIAYNIKTIFNDTVLDLNAIITPTQEATLFASTTREFFATVKPILIIDFEQYDLFIITNGGEIKKGFKDEVDTFGFGIGSYSVTDIISLHNGYALKIHPIDMDTFMLEESYVGAFQMVCEHFILKSQRNNYGMMQSVGIEPQEHIEVGDILTLRKALYDEFAISVGDTIL